MIVLPHAVFIYDEAGNPVPVVSGSTLTSGSRGFVVYGKDGNNQARNFLVDASGNLAIQNPPNLDVALSTRLSENTFTTRINTLGQKVMTGSVPVVIASDQSQITVTQGLSASLSGAWPVRITDGTNIMPVGDVNARSGFTRISNGTASVSVMTGAQTPVLADNSLLVQITPNQAPIPTTVVPATSIAGSATGRIAGVAANTFVAVRQTTYVEQTTNGQRSIVSTSANDSAAGTGARTVTITYLDASGNGPFQETVTLNGLTPVNTTNTNICFIERMDVATVGANGSNVGTLNLYTGTGATGVIFAAIGVGAIAAGVGDNQTFYAHHYVPVGYAVTGYYISVGIIASAGGGSSISVIRFRNPTVATSPWRLASDIVNAAQGNSTARIYYASIKIPGPLVIAGFGTPANNNSTLTLSFDYADEPTA